MGTNRIVCGHTPEVLKTFEPEIFDCVITSPPYWGLRDYGIEPQVWDGNGDCEHRWVSNFREKEDFKGEAKAGWLKGQKVLTRNSNPEYWEKRKIETNFCSLCGAWKGSLGLEPTPELYIKHLCDIFDEVKRVLKKTGTVWVNLGDFYEANRSYQVDGTKQIKGSQPRFQPNLSESTQPKSLVGIPEMFVLEMQRRGWIRRNTIIWQKPNCMPSSVDDRLTVDFEYVYFFVKSNDAQFWTNEKTLLLVSKQPKGIKGIEGEDWEYRICPACSNKNYFNYRTRDVERKEKDCPQFKASEQEKELKKDGKCLRCKGTGQIKYSFWSGHDYFFERQFEVHLTESNAERPRMGQGNQTIYNQKRRGLLKGNFQLGREQLHSGNINYGSQGRNKRTVWQMTKEEYLEWQADIYDVAKMLMEAKGGSVWKISTEAFKEAHFATFPQKLVQSCLLPGCPEFVCSKCGAPRVKIYEPSEEYKKLLNQSWTEDTDKDKNLRKEIGFQANTKKVACTSDYRPVGYTDCGCGEKFEGGICLDPFGGSGRVGVVAQRLRRRWILIDIKPEYCKMAEKGIVESRQNIVDRGKIKKDQKKLSGWEKFVLVQESLRLEEVC